jgi:hypothetical protein
MKQGDTAIADMVVALSTKRDLRVRRNIVSTPCAWQPHPAFLVSYKKREPLSSAVKKRLNWAYDSGYSASVTTMDLVSTDARKSASAGACGFANET